MLAAISVPPRGGADCQPGYYRSVAGEQALRASQAVSKGLANSQARSAPPGPSARELRSRHRGGTLHRGLLGDKTFEEWATNSGLLNELRICPSHQMGDAASVALA